MKLSGNKILITGGASGIGFALAQQFVQQDNEVIICGRREAALNAAAGKLSPITTRICDLSTAEERQELFEWISKDHPDLNVLVNNAGIQQWMSIADSNFFEKAHEEIAINIEAPVHLAF